MFGFDLLLSGRLDQADIALTESFRIRKLHHSRGLDTSYRNLGILRLRQGDAGSALTLLHKAVEMYESGHSSIPGWTLYFRQAQARKASGELAGALADLEQSLQLARTWRADMLPADEIQSEADINLDEVYDEYVSTGMQVWSRRHDPKLLERLFVAVEENRAASLRRDRSWRANLPRSYWDVLAQSRRLEISALAHDPAADQASLMQARGQLSELESTAGIFSQEKTERISPSQALSSFRRNLHPGNAFVSFQIGDRESFAWVLTPTDLGVSRLPGRLIIADAVRRFRSSILSGTRQDSAASGLYTMLFGDLGRWLDRAPEWILSLDDELFDVPFAALRCRGRYLAEIHSVRGVPSAFLFDDGSRAGAPKTLFAVGDPVYNSADPRWRTPADRRPAVQAKSAAPGPQSLELPRLPGSAREVAEVARCWRGTSVLTLTGRDANRARIDSLLNSHPSAVHFAIHVIPSLKGGDQALMALGLDQEGLPDFYTPAELAARRLNIPMVVLSACSSGQGEVLPGAGRMGLTRAWLLSGSRTVVASYWSTPDESGAIFSAMYRRLGRLPGPLSARCVARALQSAQAEMIRAAGWRAEPRYWAAFFLVGRD
jgi:CHAT domain-containing protein